ASCSVPPSLRDPPFQEGIVAQAVNTVTADGALYFSSAGNEGNKDDGTSGVWEGDFVDSGSTVDGNPANDFGSSLPYDTITANTNPDLITLKWSDGAGLSANDYDLYLVNSALTKVLAASTDVQSGGQDPYEDIVVSGNAVGRKLMIVKKVPSAP